MMKKNQITKSPFIIDYELITDCIPEWARKPLAESLALLPENVVDFVTQNILFISLDPYNDGECYSHDYLFFQGKKYFILLNHNLWKKKFIAIAFSIAHEVAHAFKGHEINNYEDMDFKRGILREKQADKLAIKWLSKNFRKEQIIKYADNLK